MTKIKFELQKWIPLIFNSSRFRHNTGDTLCTNTPLLDWNHLALFACQIVTLLLFISMLLSFCTYGTPWLRTKSFPWLDSVLSLSHGIGPWTVLRWNMIGYPALRSMERFISSHIYSKDAIRLNMGIGCCILILGIGATANYIGTRFRPNQARIVGLDGVLAACHGYTVASSSSSSSMGQSILFTMSVDGISTIRVDNITYFWLDVIRLLLFSNNRGLLATVVAGGMLGPVFGTLHPHWLLHIR